jgi:hypothetical protein
MSILLPSRLIQQASALSYGGGSRSVALKEPGFNMG